MYAKHGLIYLLAKLAPALASFVTLAAYTRWMSTEEYGMYTTVLVLASSVSGFMFGWLYVGIMRFWNDQAVSIEAVQRLITFSVLVIALIVGVVTSGFALLTGNVGMALAFFVIFLSSAFYEAYQRINSISLQVNQYLFTELARTVLTMGIGVLMVWLGYAWVGAATGVTLGVLLVLVFSGALWRYFRPDFKQLDFSVLKSLLVYGLPLSLSLVLLEIIHTSDRVLLGWLSGYSAAGQYAVAYNLPFQILMMLTSSLNLAAYPVVIRALETEGKAQAEARLKPYFLLLMGISVPAVFGLVGIAQVFIPLLVGPQFVTLSIGLLPWIGGAILANCIYLFYISLAFQLAKRTVESVWVVALAAVVNLLLNLALIPSYGAWGSTLASIVAYLICLGYGYYLSRRHFALEIPWLELGKVLLASGVMLGVMGQTPVVPAVYATALKIAVGIISYALAVWALDIGGSRQLFKTYHGRLFSVLPAQ